MCVNVPFVPVTVIVNVPVGPDGDVVTLSVDVVVVELGLKLKVLLDGWPDRLRATDPVNPFDGVTVTV